MISYQVDGALVDKETYDLAVTRDRNQQLLAESHEKKNLERFGQLTIPSNLTSKDFFYNPFGHGSLLEQAVWFIRDRAFHGQPNTLVNMSKMSRMINEIIDREMRLTGIIIEDRFVFGSANEYGAGGEMWIESDGRRYMTWRI